MLSLSRWYWFLLLLLSAAPLLANAGAEPGAQIEKLTRARTRVVWLLNPDVNDLQCQGEGLTLWGMDTRDKLGPRQLLAKPGNLNRPFLTPDGTRVIFTNPKLRTVSMFNFDGTGLHELCRGFGLTLWVDPTTKNEWLYVQGHEQAIPAKNPILRYNLKDLKHPEIVWNKTDITATPNANFQLSADGTRAATLFPWPNAGLANLRDQTWQMHATGCWPGMAPDNSYRFWVFDSSHRSVTMFGPGGIGQSTLVLTGAPNSDNKEVYHPRWSNHVRFITHTAPKYKPSHVYIAALDQDFKKVDGWVQVTPPGTAAAMMPDVWIEGQDPDAQRTPSLQPLPVPWQAHVLGQAIGCTGGRDDDKIFLQSQSGDIYGSEDTCHFVNQRLVGDGQITAHLNSYLNIGPNGRIALMLRELPEAKPSAQAATIHLSLRPGKKTLSFAWRPRTASATTETEMSLPKLEGTADWIRLVRRGDTFSGYYSRDGKTWHDWGTTKVSVAQTLGIGMALSSDGPVAGTVIWDLIELSGSLPDTPATRPATLPQPEAVLSEIRGKIISVGRTPTLQEIQPYNAALTADVVEIQSTTQGPALSGRILVCHYVIRDGKVLAGADGKNHAEVILRLIPLEKQRKEKTLRLILPDVGYDLPTYYVVEK
ncbi:MAG: hypothetical protein WCJ97_00185 [Phycisphaerae bacterium]